MRLEYFYKLTNMDIKTELEAIIGKLEAVLGTVRLVDLSSQPVAQEASAEQPAEVTPTADEVVEQPEGEVASDSPAAPEAAE